MKLSNYLYLALTAAFLLGNHNGFVALWKDSAPEPLAVFPYRIESLPPYDQQRLNRGIRIGSEEELHALLEDFLS